MLEYLSIDHFLSWEYLKILFVEKIKSLFFILYGKYLVYLKKSLVNLAESKITANQLLFLYFMFSLHNKVCLYYK